MDVPASLNFHVPVPRARPGEVPDFGGLKLSAANAIARPDARASLEALRDLPLDLICALDDHGKAAGEWVPNLDPGTLRRGLRAMVLTRLFEDRMFKAQRQGKASVFLKSLGEEAVGAALASVMEMGEMCFPTYRMMSWLILRDYPLVDIVNHVFSNAGDPLKGRQWPVLFSARDCDYFAVSGNLGNHVSQAVGWAMASAYTGGKALTLACIGEGSTSEGAFHEALTFASVYHAPIIVCVVNNQWASSTFSGMAGALETTFAARALGHGLPGLRVDGNDFLAICGAVQWARARCRANLGATLIELVTYRGGSHTTSDDPARYRPADEPKFWPLGDPVERLKQHLVLLGEWDRARDAALEEACKQEVDAAITAGEAIGTLGKSKPGLREMFDDVYKEPDWRILEQRRELGV